MYISKIIWPKAEDEIMKLYLSFIIKVLELIQIRFTAELNDPLQLGKKFLAGEVSESEYAEGAALCWAYLDDRDALRNFNDQDILLARLGISLLSANKDFDQMGEKLAWFFEILDSMKVDIDPLLEIMRQYFEFED